MLITKIKKKEEITPYLTGNVLFISCLGCKEVSFEVNELEELKKQLKEDKVNVVGDIVLDYLCNDEFTKKRIEIYSELINKAETILVFACGVGIQTLASLIPEKKIVSGCDTFYLPGFQGITPLEHDCEQCGECMLGYTVGICPITACSKGLLNGPCGGAKNGKCEVSKEKECGWERILHRMDLLKEPYKLKDKIKLRDFGKSQ